MTGVAASVGAVASRFWSSCWITKMGPDRLQTMSVDTVAAVVPEIFAGAYVLGPSVCWCPSVEDAVVLTVQQCPVGPVCARLRWLPTYPREMETVDRVCRFVEGGRE